MSTFFKQQMAGVRATLEDLAQQLILTTLLALVALASLIGCVVFASIAAYLWLATAAGAVVAAAALAALYLLIAIACILAIWANGAARRSRGKAAAHDGLQNNAKLDSAKLAVDEIAAASPTEADPVDPQLAAIAAVLQQVGLHDPNAAVLVAAALAKQIPPFALVAAAFASGLAFGRR
jgi:hypothetical protein